MFGVKKNAGAPSGSNGLMERRIPATNGVQTPQPFSQQPQSGFAETDGETPAKTEREQAIAKINRFGVDIRGAFEEYISGQQDMVNSVIEAVVSGAHFCAIGPYGIGKSYIPRVLYKLLGVDGRTVAMHPETTHADVNGFVSLDPRTGQKITNPSPFFESLVVLVDEVNRSGERGRAVCSPFSTTVRSSSATTPNDSRSRNGFDSHRDDESSGRSWH